MRESAISEPLGPALQEVAPLDRGKPREVRRALDDVQRALEQSWLLVAAYLTLPTAEDREDLLWSARTVEKIRTDPSPRKVLGTFPQVGADGDGEGQDGPALALSRGALPRLLLARRRRVTAFSTCQVDWYCLRLNPLLSYW